MLKALHLLALIIFLTSCSKEESEKIKGELYYPKSTLHSDEDLLELEIKIPPQQESLSKNQHIIENILKKYNQDHGLIDINLLDRVLIGFNWFSADKFNYAPIIDGDRAYILSNYGVLSKIDLNSKKRIWKKRVFGLNKLKNYQIPKISIAQGVIYAIAGSNQVAAINSDNGNIIWLKNISSIPISKVVHDQDLVYFITQDNKTFALNKSNGEIKWIHYGIFQPTAIFGSANPVIYKNYLLSAYSSGEVYLLDKKNGQLLWYQDLNLDKIGNTNYNLSDIDASPIIKNGIAYLISNNGVMIALKIDNKTILWQKEIASVTDFTIAGDFIYLIEDENNLLAIHRINGKVKWVKQLPDFKNSKKPQTKIIYNGVDLIGDKLFITDIWGNIYLISPLNGEIASKFKLGAKIYDKPVVESNKIYFYGKGLFINYLIELE